MAMHGTQKGGCLCGRVRYEVTGETVWSAGCCCESCTRAAGAPIVVWAGFTKADFRFVQGDPAIYQSSRGISRKFCRDCGTTLTYQKDPSVIRRAQDDVYVATRTFDDPDAFPPTEHVFYGERVGWFEIGGDTPRYDTVSPGNAHRSLLTMSRD